MYEFFPPAIGAQFDHVVGKMRLGTSEDTTGPS